MSKKEKNNKVESEETRVENQVESQESKVESLEARVAELEEHKAELEDKNLRMMAEFDNFRKRTNKEKLDLMATAGERIFKDMLPLVDDFERALVSINGANGENGANGGSLMMLCSEGLRVALVCNHVSIADIPSQITEERILAKLNILQQSLIRDFGLEKPRIAVLALNPHAGDAGLLGKEEQEIIAPAIQKANEQGLWAFGPYAADGFFGSGHFKHFDAVLAMYHDQGLIPFKTLDMSGVNYTAGLPVIRTSPDHGTAYDLVGKDQADFLSMRNAMYMAYDLIRARAEYDELRENPLPFIEREDKEGRPRREFIDFKTTKYDSSRN